MPTTTKGDTVVTKPGKQPADHKSKADKPVVEKIDGGRRITHLGISIDVPDEAFDDFELLDDLRAVQDAQDASRMPSLLRRLAGDDGYRAVMSGLRDPETGRVSVMAGAEYVQSLFEALAPN